MLAYPGGMSRISLRGSSHIDLLATLPGRVIRTLVIALLALGANLVCAEVPKPVIAIAKPGQCIAPVEEMRRNHMDMLRHQRDRTLRLGEREAKVSLNACIDCHASRDNGSVLGDKENFCQGCHAYAAVKLDCFECHQAKAKKTAEIKP